MKLANGLNTLFLKLIGSGKQGVVYQIDQHKCVKVYTKEKYCRRELMALQKGQDSSFFPELYEWGDVYIVREMIHGKTLKEYLQRNHLSKPLTRQILKLYHTLEDLGFKRLDFRLPHLFLTPEDEIKLIDPTNMIKHRRKFPRKFLSGLDKMGEKERFLEYVRRLDPLLYQRWQKKLQKH